MNIEKKWGRRMNIEHYVEKARRGQYNILR